MLDQNTDRMWYVIGAVIIGAALIFILNGTMPELFASVGGTFDDKTKEVGRDVAAIGPVTVPEGDRPIEFDKYNLIQMSNIEKGYFNYLTGANSDEAMSNHMEFERMGSRIPIEPNTKYYMSHNLESTRPDIGVEMAWSFYDKDRVVIPGSHVYGQKAIIIDTPSNAAFMRIRYGLHIEDWSTRDYYLTEYKNIVDWGRDGV